MSMKDLKNSPTPSEHRSSCSVKDKDEVSDPESLSKIILNPEYDPIQQYRMLKR